MAFEFKRWAPTLKLAILFLIFFFLASNFSSLWLFHKARKGLENEVKAKLESSAAHLANYLEEAAGGPETRASVQDYLRRQNLLAFGFSPGGALPAIWTNPQQNVPFMAEYSAASNFVGPVKFAGHHTCTYYFKLPAKAAGSQPAGGGFLVAETARLGELQEALRRQIAIWVVGFMIMLVTVVLLWRFILAPFEEMERKAAQANLPEKPAGEDPAQAMVETFEKVIAELMAKEAELSRLYRESEKKARHYSALSSHLLESLNSGIVIFNRSGEVVDSNPAAQELLGLGDRTESSPALNEILQKAVREKQDGVETELETGGRKKTLAVSASQISNSEGEILGKALLLYDLTGLKEMEKKLKENEHWAFLGETAAGLAHELRNALAVMVGYARLLDKALGTAGPARKTAAELLKEAGAAEATLKSFLDYARPQAVEHEKLDLRKILEECLSAVRARFPGVRFRASLPEAMPCTGDAGLVKQIFSNLLRNGAEAGKKGGRVDISASYSVREKTWEMHFSDSGPGIPPEHRSKIFSPFFTTKPEGTGLGLALVKKAVHLLEGQIKLGDAAQGVDFVLSLPAGLGNDAQKNEVHEFHDVG
jgi:signal transduction histidine kinase